MSELFWRAIAKLLSVRWVASLLIKYSQRTPYTHIHGPDGSVYMYRWWVFNPYPAASDGRRRRWADWIPSARVHRIMKPDSDRHMHDHPWNARTIILKGWYDEQRQSSNKAYLDDLYRFVRLRGDTATLRFGEYHRICAVPESGVWTLFITWRYQGTWGFLVDGKKVPWRDYLRQRDQL